jgi:hypothetical protein
VTSRRAVIAALTVAVALALSGCGLGVAAPTAGTKDAPAAATTSSARATAPSASATATGPSAAAIARTRVTHELPTPAPPDGRESVTGGWRTPAAAVSAFAVTYVNWTAATVAVRLRSLSRASVGQARAVTARAAAEVARDRELHEGAVANSGTVEAVAAVSGRPRAYAVVTRERTTAAHDGAYRGLAPAWHVSVATVIRQPDGLWVLSGWQPEN